VFLPVFKIPGKEIQQYCNADQADICVNMADRISREIHAGAFEPEDEESYRRYCKDDAVCYQQVFTRPAAVEIENELDEGEYSDDEGKQDHRRHKEKPEQVRNAREGGQ